MGAKQRGREGRGAIMTEISNGASVIRIENMTKRYRGQVAVDRLTLDVPAGSVFGLLGENGAGKTTTIQSLLGLIVPDAGRVETLGLDPSRRSLEVRRRVGYVPEQASLYDWMTVAEIGWFAAGFHPEPGSGTAAYQERYRGMAEGFNLPLDRKIRHLSKGMKAKVSLALALAPAPELLILDEPTSGLDLMVRREFLESMVDLAGAGRTVLLSSHQVAEVDRVASHVAFLHEGRLILAEPLDDLRARTFVLTLTFNDRDHPLAPPEDLPIDLVDANNAAFQAIWLVHAPAAAIEALRRVLPGLVALESKPATLEEIYIGYMRRRRPDSGPAPLAAAQVA
jgi:ABC-2 type transport system ATP-binding protein